MIRSKEKITDRASLQYIKGKEDRLASFSWTKGGVKQSMWVKSTCQSSPGIESQSWWAKKVRGGLGWWMEV
jgi:hypothetical protein